jgi:uncharacterized protein (UPF0276 family)
MRQKSTALGHGIGLRPKHFSQFMTERPALDFVEAVSENFFARGGRALTVLDKVRRDIPVVLHGVSLSIGAVDALDHAYLRQLRTLIDRVEPALVSDHLCWGKHGGRYAHELWPLPYTEQSLAHVVSRVAQVQELLGRRISLENVSSYIEYRTSNIPEWEFLAELASRADCHILLDVNNVYVSSQNHGFDPRRYIEHIPRDRVQQIHLGGHSDQGRYLLDSHDGPISSPVWELYRTAIAHLGAVSTTVEWDDNIPDLPLLLAESHKARAIEAATLATKEHAA